MQSCTHSGFTMSTMLALIKLVTWHTHTHTNRHEHSKTHPPITPHLQALIDGNDKVGCGHGVLGQHSSMGVYEALQVVLVLSGRSLWWSHQCISNALSPHTTQHSNNVQ